MVVIEFLLLVAGLLIVVEIIGWAAHCLTDFFRSM